MKDASPVHDNRLPSHKVAVGRAEKNQRAHEIIRRLQPLDRPFLQLQFRQRLGRILQMGAEPNTPVLQYSITVRRIITCRTNAITLSSLRRSIFDQVEVLYEGKIALVKHARFAGDYQGIERISHG